MRRLSKLQSFSQAGPVVWHFQEVPVHGLDEPLLVLLGRHDRRQLALPSQNATLFDHRFEFLVPSESPDVICAQKSSLACTIDRALTDNPQDKFFVLRVQPHQQRVIHDGLRGQKLGVILDRSRQHGLGMWQNVQRGIARHWNCVLSHHKKPKPQTHFSRDSRRAARSRPLGCRG
jgi:hypothetical protein